MRRSTSGFTIVEVLIVVVVIGILAAISIVTYNGIVDRAKRAEQQSQLDAVGKAIKFYAARHGGLKGAGSGGNWVGALNTTYGQPASMRDVLISAGYYNGSVDTSKYLVAPCTNTRDSRRVVLAQVDPKPVETVEEQLSGSGCNNNTINLYSNDSYARNFARVY